MAFGGIARWLRRRRESNLRPRPSASFLEKAKPSPTSASFPEKAKDPEQHGAGRRTATHARTRFSEVDKRRADTEIDGFVVPEDVGDWTSCSDSDDSDWSIGWFEPLSSRFSSDDESENSFGVLVPCYGPSSRHVVDSRGKKTGKTRILDTIQPKNSSQDSQKYVEKWLESLKRQ